MDGRSARSPKKSSSRTIASPRSSALRFTTGNTGSVCWLHWPRTFEGLRLIIGDRNFEKLSIAYLHDCPSQSFTLRNLGSRLESWLRTHPEFVAGVEDIAIDMVRLEWAEIEAFDEAAKPALTESDLPKLGPDPQFDLQPYIRLLDLQYPVDQMLLAIRREQRVIDIVSNAVHRASSAPASPHADLAQTEKTFSRGASRREFGVFQAARPRSLRYSSSALRDGKRLSEAVEHVNWNRRLRRTGGRKPAGMVRALVIPGLVLQIRLGRNS